MSVARARLIEAGLGSFAAFTAGTEGRPGTRR